MAPQRILTSALAVAASLALTGCALVPFPRPEASAPTAAASAPAESDAPNDAQNEPTDFSQTEIVVLTDDAVTENTQFTRSTPAGSWPVGPGVPPGFPAGVPLYPDRWTKDSVGESTTGSDLPSYYVTFWGGYADLDELSVRFLELGFEKTQREDETKRVIIYENDRYRVTINASESAVDPVTQELIDPSYRYTVVFLD